VKLTAIRGCPGSGKTTALLGRAEAGEFDAVFTFTKDAAKVIKQRSPITLAGTVYSLTWPWVKSLGTRHGGRARGNKAYVTRAVTSGHDPTLDEYVRDAPSARKAKSDELRWEQELHRWDGVGALPPEAKVRSPKLRFAQGIARWVHAGCPKGDGEGFDTIAIDEAQDFSTLELLAALGTLKPGGQAFAYGDPGQAIFSESKGLKGSELPPVWARADTLEEMRQGFRVGAPVADAAAAALTPWLPTDPGLFRADHATSLLNWGTMTEAPRKGLVLGWSRYCVRKAFKEWGLTNTWVTPNEADADRELVVCTGHSAKGAEADDVYLLPVSRKGDKMITERDPAALRWLYVAMTRAKRRLFIPPALRAIIPK